VALLTGPSAQEFLTAAEAGEFRTRKSNRHESTAASGYVRASVMRELATLVGAQGVVPSVPRSPGRGWTPPAVRARFLTALRQDGTLHGLRIATVAHLADSGLRVGEIASLRLENLDARGDVRSVVRNAPGPGDPYLVDHSVDKTTAALVRSWVNAREDLVASERVQEIFLTLKPSSRHGATYAVGLPVSARSLDRDHRASASAWLMGDGRHWANGAIIEDLTLSRLAHQPERAQDGW
jgi:integrase